MDLNVAFFGTPQIAAITLKRLITTKFKPGLIVTGQDVQKSRRQKLTLTPVKKVAQENDIKILEPQNLDEEKFIEEFVNFSPDVAILIAYGKLIPSKILAIPKHGFINIHPSLLPKYRGPSPIYQALLNGDETTGVTIIKLDEDLDHGPIIAQKELAIEGNDTHESLAKKLAILGTDLLIYALLSYLDKSVNLGKQDHSKAVWTKKITKEDGYIDLEKPPDPEKLDRMIRAFYPWPGVYTKLKMKNEKLKIIKFLHDSPFLIQPEGKRPMTIKEFLNGYPQFYDQLKPILKSLSQQPFKGATLL